LALAVALLLSAFSLVGCTHPSAANIELRKQNSDLRSQIASLNRRHDADAATIRSLEKKNATTTPTLASDRLAELFTVHGIQFGRLTGGADLDPKSPGDEGIKVYVIPIDQDGETIKATGSFIVDAFDLDLASGMRVAHCETSAADARKLWFGEVLLHTYVLTCPWERRPVHSDLTLKVSFTDSLTGRQFEAQKRIKVELPPSATQPSRELPPATMPTASP
jgi:hypothetical protein